MEQSQSSFFQQLETLREENKEALESLKKQMLEHHRKEAKDIVHAQEEKHTAALEVMKQDVIAEQSFKSELVINKVKAKYEQELVEVRDKATQLGSEETKRLLAEQEVRER